MRYRFITDDDTARFCNRVTEVLQNGWKLNGEPKMTFNKKTRSNALWLRSYKKRIK